MSVEGGIGVAEYGTIDDNFDNVDWIDSIDVTNDPTTQQVTYDSTVTTICNIQQSRKVTSLHKDKHVSRRHKWSDQWTSH